MPQVTGQDLGNGASESIQTTVKFFKSLAEKIDSILIDSLSQTYQSVAKATYPIVMGVIVLWVMYYGITLITNPSRVERVQEFLWKFGKIFVIAVIAFTWGYIYQFIVDPVMNGSNEFIAKAAGADAEQLLLDNVGRIFSLVTNTTNEMSTATLDVSAGLIVALISFANFIMAALQIVAYFFIVIESKILIAILLILAPIFLSFLMFDSTKNYFQNWVSAILHPIITLLIMAIVMSFMGYVTQYALTSVLRDGTYEVSISNAFLALIVSLFTIMFIL